MSSSAISPTRMLVNGLPDHPRRVLLVMLNHHLGDFVLSMPTLVALANTFQCPVDLLTDERNAELVRSMPGFERIIEVNQAHRRGAAFSRVRAFIRMASALSRSRYDVVFDVGGGIQAVTATLLTRARYRVGLRRRRRSWAYSVALEDDGIVHQIDTYRPFTKALDLPRPGALELHATADARKAAEDQLARRFGAIPRDLAILHPGAGYAFRKWPAERFSEVADALVARWGLSVAVIGSRAEVPLLKHVATRCIHRDRIQPVTVPVGALIELFRRGKILVSNESGPTHLAATTSIPIVTIFGPSKEDRWRPVRAEGVRILRARACDKSCSWGKCELDFACVRGVEVKDVLAAATELLN